MMATVTRCACVDIGSNTTRLLVAERSDGALREVAARRHFVPLGCEAGDTIPAADVAAVARIVATHALVAREHGCDALRVVATAAVREAANGADLCAAVAATAGVEVEVLSAAEEAALAFAGATAGLPAGDALGVIDIGGGSSELVAGTPGDGVAWWRSLSVGSGLLTTRHDDLVAVRAEIDAALAGVEPPPVTRALAVGGSAMSLRKVAGEELAPADIEDALGTLAELPAEVAALHFGVDPRRARLMPAGLMLLAAAWRAFGGVPLRIADGGLREGVVLQELGA
jgi:exopolyphosphatase / guanosine-5'-triphosphate,3'-diphosphate pyrophosphatase